MSTLPETSDLLKSVTRLFVSSLPLGEKLGGIIESISKSLGSDQCLLLTPEEIVPHGFLNRVAQGKKPLWANETSGRERGEVLPEERGLLQESFGLIPLWDEATFRGILHIGFSRNHPFSPQEIDLLLLVARVLQTLLGNEQIRREEEKAREELQGLQEIGKAITSTLKLEDLFETILTTGLKIFRARGGVVRIEDKKKGELKTQYSIGDYHQAPLDRRIAKRVFFTKTPLSLNRSGEGNSFLSILCAPFLLKGRSFGTLTFYDKETHPSRFDERDLHLLLMVSHQLSYAVENAMAQYEISTLAREQEKRVKQLSTLWELNKALLTTVHLERILQMTLTAITIGDGLGFNRAMLFLVNEKTRRLEGATAVGPNSAEEAGRIWSALSQRKGNPSELITQLQPPLDKDSVLNSLVKGIGIPLEQEQCLLSRTVLEGRPFNVRVPQAEEGWLQARCERGCHLGSEVGCYVSEHLSRDPRVYSFASVPLWGKGKVIGVILVDNLYNQNPITDEDIHYLAMFCNQAGLAIENAMLYRNLEEVHQKLKETQTFLLHQEKMAALGELSTSVAHEIRNPLVSIGGFARRLDRITSPEAAEKRYTQTIMKEVRRLEKILEHILTYTHEESVALKELDLRGILEESLSMASEGWANGGLRLVKEFSEKLPMVRGNHDQLKQAFFNLIHNACESMNGKGSLSVRIHPVSKNGSSFVRVEVEDTGAGIDPENLHNIFNPFYSTKENRLGLGLPIIHKIVTSHQGQIEVDNQPGRGATFTITLPAQEEKGNEKDFGGR